MLAESISKWMSHSLGTARPSCLAGANFQSWAACKARSAKNWLGPRESMVAWVTARDSSTWTFIETRTVPRMVSRADCAALGKTCCKTFPWVTPGAAPVELAVGAAGGGGAREAALRGAG